jgi:hypothetical protein
MTICSFNRHKVEPRKHLLEIFELPTAHQKAAPPGSSDAFQRCDGQFVDGAIISQCAIVISCESDKEHGKLVPRVNPH